MRYARISPRLTSFANRFTTRAKGTACAAARAGNGRQIDSGTKTFGML
jgi:hypothetical protein